MKTVTILGATGSVGSSTLDLARTRARPLFRVRDTLTANCDVDRAGRCGGAGDPGGELAVVADESLLAEP